MSLAKHAKSAVLWNAAFMFFRTAILGLGSFLIFRRLLAPSDYGIFNFVNSVIGFLQMFAFNCFVAYTVQVRDEQDTHFQNHFTAGAFFQIPLFIITNLVAFGLRWFPQYAVITPYLHLVSLLFLLDWGCEFRRKMLERAFNWPRLRALHAIGLLAGFLVQLWLVLAHYGAYALVVPVLVVTLPFIIDLFIISKWRPSWTWSWKDYKPAWRFGWTRVASGLAFRGRQLIESAVVVSLLGLGKLGILGSAVGFGQMLCQNFAEQLMAAIYPVLTRVNPDPHNVSRVNALVLRLIAWVTIPVGWVAALLAGQVLLDIWGSKWSPIAPLLPWAMLAGVAVTLAQTANTLLLSKEKLKHCLVADFLVLAGTVLALIFALPHGLQAYLMTIACVQLVVLVLMLVWLVEGHHLKTGGVFDALLPALLACAIAFGVCQAALKGTGADIKSFWVAVVYGAGFTLLYLLVLRLGFTARLRELAVYVPGSKYLNRILRLDQDGH